MWNANILWPPVLYTIKQLIFPSHYRMNTCRIIRIAHEFFSQINRIRVTVMLSIIHLAIRTFIPHESAAADILIGTNLYLKIWRIIVDS